MVTIKRMEEKNESRIKAELNEAGYAFVQEHNFLPKQYFLVFEQAKK